MLRVYITFYLLILSFIGVWAQVPNADKVGQIWATDTSNKTVPLNEFKALLKRDAIPPIDAPTFLQKSKAMEAYFKHEPVIALEINGEAKAYPLNILTYHEVVNDKIGGYPITATYCPLCNAAIAFDRKVKVDGQTKVLDFGVSGMLRRSDMVMWDRQTETWWQQFTGEGLVGKLAGTQLNLMPSFIISIEEFFQRYPKGLVLSPETGSKEAENYGTNYYENYDALSNTQPRLFFEKVDERLPATERVIDIHDQKYKKVYPLSIVQRKGVINDRIGDKFVVIFHQSGTISILDTKDIKQGKDLGSVTVFNRILDNQVLSFQKTKTGFVDEQTKSLWDITGRCITGSLKGKQLKKEVYGNHFAFAWLSFFPESEVYTEND